VVWYFTGLLGWKGFVSFYAQGNNISRSSSASQIEPGCPNKIKPWRHPPRLYFIFSSALWVSVVEYLT
jgi:hypothetical protein